MTSGCTGHSQAKIFEPKLHIATCHILKCLESQNPMLRDSETPRDTQTGLLWSFMWRILMQSYVRAAPIAHHSPSPGSVTELRCISKETLQWLHCLSQSSFLAAFTTNSCNIHRFAALSITFYNNLQPLKMTTLKNQSQTKKWGLSPVDHQLAQTHDARRLNAASWKVICKLPHLPLNAAFAERLKHTQ